MTDSRTPDSTPNAGADAVPAADHEAFLARLTAADPVDPATIPSADAPAATQLLDQILATTAGEPSRPGAPIVTPVHTPDSVPGTGSGRGNPSWSRRLLTQGRGGLVAVAAAVLVVVGAVAVLAPDNTPAALAQVHNAAATTADADSGRIVTDFAIDYADEELTDSAAGEIEVIYDGGDLGISVQVDDVPSELDDDTDVDAFLPALDDVRLVDDVAYIQQDGQWLAVDTGGLLGDLVVRYVDPRTVLDTVQDLSETTEVGPADVDGIATTQYRSVIDLGDETLAQSGWLAFDGMDAEVEGEVTVDLFVDESGALVRFDLSGDLAPSDGTDGSATFEMTTSFTDTGEEMSIEAPEGAEVFDPLADGFGQDD